VKLSLEEKVGQCLLVSFTGKDRPSDELREIIERYKPAGITLFRSQNIDEPTQLRELNQSLQRLARDFDLPPFLIAADQEGGQLMALGRGTPLPGNMALGATGSEDLACRVGEVLGRELAAVGVNLDYAPCADVNLNTQNPVVGVRSFGEGPVEVARLTAALIRGIQSQGVAATVKHFPGHGDVTSDSHHGLPIVSHSLERLRAVEFPPFRSAIEAGVKLVMTAHIGLPAIDGPHAPPATLSPNILQGVLRRELGFEGVIVTDAMNMRAIRQEGAIGEEAVRALSAGADLLLLVSNLDECELIFKTIIGALKSGRLDERTISQSAQRVLALKEWLSKQPAAPDLSVVDCAEHRSLAQEIADASITLVRDQNNLLPLCLRPDRRLAVIIPKPLDLTPADTSSYVTPQLAAALREYHPRVEEFLIPYAPNENDIASLLTQLHSFDAVIIGTINAFQQEGQAALVRKSLKLKIPTVIAALRLPYDLTVFPEAPVYLCTYGILEPSMRALAKAVFGQGGIKGRLPVAIPGLAEAGYHLGRNRHVTLH